MPCEPLDAPENLPKESRRQVALRQLRDEVAGMPNKAFARLEQPLLEAREGPAPDDDGQNQPAQKIAEVVGDHAEQQADLIGPAAVAREARPVDRDRLAGYEDTNDAEQPRGIAKVEHHLGELFPRVGFIVTTLTGTNRAVVRFYNQRETAEQWIKEGIDRLAEEARQRKLPDCVRCADQRGPLDQGVKAETFVQLAREQQPSIGGHRGSAELDAKLRVEREANRARVHVTY
jgi:hypothetical protein